MHFLSKDRKKHFFKKTLSSVFLGFIIFTCALSTGATIAKADCASGSTNSNGTCDYTVLQPLPGTTENGCGNNSTSLLGDFCQATLFGSGGYLQGIFNLSIGVGAIVAFVMLTLYGFEYMFTDSLNVKTVAKEGLANALWGLGIVLFAWVILATVGGHLVNGNITFASPTIAPLTTTVAGTTPPAGTGAGGTSGGGVLVTNVDATATEGASASALENAVRAGLDQPPYYITVNNGACGSLSSTNCTDVGGLTNNTISQAEAMAAACKCSPMITGGNEPNGHDAASHPAGNGVDFGSNSALTAYLVSATGIPNPPVIGTTYSGVTLNGQKVNILYETTGTTSSAPGSTSVSNGSHVHITFTGN